MTNPNEQRHPKYYDDGLIQLDREALTLRRYHFPSGTSKIIPLRDIRNTVRLHWGWCWSASDCGAAPIRAGGCRWTSADR